MSNYINFQPVTKLTKLAVNPNVVGRDQRLDPDRLNLHLQIHRHQQRMQDILNRNQEILEQRRQGFLEGLQPPRIVIPDVPGAAGIGGPLGLGMNPEDTHRLMLRALPPAVRMRLAVELQRDPAKAWEKLTRYYAEFSRRWPIALEMLRRRDQNAIARALAAAQMFGVPADQADLALVWLMMAEDGIDFFGEDAQQPAGGPHAPGGRPLVPQIQQPDIRHQEVAAIVANPQILALAQQQQAARQGLEARMANLGVRPGQPMGGISTLNIGNENNLKEYDNLIKTIANGQIAGLPRSYVIAANLSWRANDIHKEQNREYNNPDQIVQTFIDVLNEAAQKKVLAVFHNFAGAELDFQQIPEGLQNIAKKDLQDGWKMFLILNNNPTDARLGNPENQRLMKLVVVYKPVIVDGKYMAIVTTTAHDLWQAYNNARGDDAAQNRIAKIIEANFNALDQLLPENIKIGQ
jgi:hypothetical protein